MQEGVCLGALKAAVHEVVYDMAWEIPLLPFGEELCFCVYESTTLFWHVKAEGLVADLNQGEA